MSVRNFSQEQKFANETFELPLIFNFGVSMDIMDFIDEQLKKNHNAYFSIDATHPRSHPEQILVGLEYVLKDMVALRMGYTSNSDEDDINYGLGISKYGFNVDYGFTPFGRLGDVHRFTFQFKL